MNRIDEIIYKETQKADYEEQCERGFVHQEQPNEDYFEGLNDYLDGTMSIWNSHFFRRLEEINMKIYVLSKQGYDGNETICVSEDINKIRTSICEDFDANEDYPVFEIWENGEMIYQTSGSDVLKAISKEMYRN